jgi:hypothetical protein
LFPELVLVSPRIFRWLSMPMPIAYCLCLCLYPLELSGGSVCLCICVCLLVGKNWCLYPQEFSGGSVCICLRLCLYPRYFSGGSVRVCQCLCLCLYPKQIWWLSTPTPMHTPMIVVWQTRCLATWVSQNWCLYPQELSGGSVCLRLCLYLCLCR